MNSADLKKKSRRIFKKLEKQFPNAHCELDFKNPFQLLCATVLSAQCTDVAVNKVTPSLFRRFPSAKIMSGAKQGDIEALIKSIGLFRNKSKSLLGLAKMLMLEFGGEVPCDRDQLVRLPGVGRKTANVVLSNAFGLPGLAVDTHVLRVGKRLGLFESQDPVKVEVELGELMPPEKWGLVSHLLIWHGRRTCDARKPKCSECVLIKDCNMDKRREISAGA